MSCSFCGIVDWGLHTVNYASEMSAHKVDMMKARTYLIFNNHCFQCCGKIHSICGWHSYTFTLCPYWTASAYICWTDTVGFAALRLLPFFTNLNHIMPKKTLMWLCTDFLPIVSVESNKFTTTTAEVCSTHCEEDKKKSQQVGCGALPVHTLLPSPICPYFLL